MIERLVVEIPLHARLLVVQPPTGLRVHGGTEKSSRLPWKCWRARCTVSAAHSPFTISHYFLKFGVAGFKNPVLGPLSTPALENGPAWTKLWRSRSLMLSISSCVGCLGRSRSMECERASGPVRPVHRSESPLGGSTGPDDFLPLKTGGAAASVSCAAAAAVSQGQIINLVRKMKNFCSVN